MDVNGRWLSWRWCKFFSTCQNTDTHNFPAKKWEEKVFALTFVQPIVMSCFPSCCSRSFACNFFCLIFACRYYDVAEKKLVFVSLDAKRGVRKKLQILEEMNDNDVIPRHMSLHLEERCDGIRRRRRFWTHRFQHADFTAMSKPLMRNARVFKPSNWESCEHGSWNAYMHLEQELTHLVDMAHQCTPMLLVWPSYLHYRFFQISSVHFFSPSAFQKRGTFN